MNPNNFTRRIARHPGESAYPQLWKDLVAAWAPSGVPKHPTRLLDYSGNGNHGTLSNGANWTPGYKGWGVGFDGADDDVVGDSPGKNFPVGGESRTVACWIRSGNYTGDHGIVHWGTDGAVPVAGNFHLVAGDGGVILWGNGYGHGILNGVTTWNNNRWHHVAGTYDKNSGAATIYINGKTDASGTYTSTPNTGTVNSWRMARFINGYGALECKISDCFVFKRCLSAKEIRMLGAGKTPFTQKAEKQKIKNVNRGFSQAAIFC